MSPTGCICRTRLNWRRNARCSKRGDRLTKERLEQYRDICKEIEEIKADIAKRELLVTDTVIGSAPDYPYTTHPISVQGLADYHGKRLSVTKTLKDRAVRLETERDEIEKFLSEISDSNVRRIIRMRYIERKSWQHIAHKMEITESGARMIINRYLK